MRDLFAFVPATANVAILAMVVACLLPIVWAMLAKIWGGFVLKDNQNPRAFYADLQGKAFRANAVQQNGREGLPIFLASVITAMLFFVPQSVVNNLAVMYIILRLIYGIAYISNLSTFRSVVWTLSMACPLLLFYLAIRVAF